jgi:hypothetical protein
MNVLALVALGFIVLPIVFPGHGGHAAGQKKSQCLNNLKQFGIALQNYLSVYGSFPPAYVADSHGRPMHSWRVLILPYFELDSTTAAEVKTIYDEYDFSEPWEGPNNRRLIERMPDVFHCPSENDAPSCATNYVAVVGDHTAWPFAVGRTAKEITDGLGSTLLVVETTGRGVAWTEPRDLDFDQLDFTINSPSGYGAASKHLGAGVNALMSDGSVRFIPQTLDPGIFRGLLTVDGCEPAPPP